MPTNKNIKITGNQKKHIPNIGFAIGRRICIGIIAVNYGGANSLATSMDDKRIAFVKEFLSRIVVD